MNVLLIFSLSVCLYGCVLGNDYITSEEKNIRIKEDSSKSKIKCDEKEKCEDDDDDEKYMYEPCNFPDDVDCVRNFFATHSQCRVVEHDYDKPVNRERYTTYFPSINLTLITTKARIWPENGKIKSFYINKRTNNLVMAVDFKGLFIDSKEAYFIVSRRGKEPAVAVDFARGSYPATITAVIPLKDGLSIKESSITTFVLEPTIRFAIGPKVTNSKDPAIMKAVLGLFANIPSAIKEFYFFESSSFFLAYLQTNICNFGIPISA